MRAAPEVSLRTSPPEEHLPIDQLRTEIDEIDRVLAGNLRQRADLSRRVQAARIESGGVRVDISREQDIFANYRANLGPDGAIIADAILRLCRGIVA
jgi:chorismate mutase